MRQYIIEQSIATDNPNELYCACVYLLQSIIIMIAPNSRARKGREGK